jgi:hypothetical protein
MVFTWRQSNVRLGGGCLVVKEPAYERESEAPLIPGVWMQYATCKGSDHAIRHLAALYGFLRAPGETAASWHVFILQLAFIARPWVMGGPSDEWTEMPAPGIGSAAAIAAAHAYSRELRQQTLTLGDIALDPGDVIYEMAPRTLAGYLAHQAALALLERPHFRRCAHCHYWFAVGRADQRYCMPRHRAAAHKEKENNP